MVLVWLRGTPITGARTCRAREARGCSSGSTCSPRLQLSDSDALKPQNSIYNFENWARQLNAFIEEIVGEPAFIMCNSVKGAAGQVWR